MKTTFILLHIIVIVLCVGVIILAGFAFRELNSRTKRLKAKNEDIPKSGDVYVDADDFDNPYKQFIRTVTVVDTKTTDDGKFVYVRYKCNGCGGENAMSLCDFNNMYKKSVNE